MEKLDMVRDATSCKAWLAGVAPKDSERAIPAYGALLRSLESRGLAPGVLLDILEVLRGPVLSALRVAIRDIEYRALPLDADEWAQFLAQRALATALHAAYTNLVPQLPDSLPAKAAPQGTVAVIPRVQAIQRGLDMQARIIASQYRARVTPPQSDWDELCTLAEVARDLRCLDDEVPDLLSPDRMETCRAAFVFPILLRLSLPATLTAPEFGVARMCARSWAGKVGFRIDPGTAPAGESPGPAFPISAEHYIRLDTQRLLQSLQRRVQGLREGKTPQELGFDAKLSPQTCRYTLQRLAAAWVRQIDGAHAFRQHPVGGFAQAFIGIPKAEAPAVPRGPHGYGEGAGPYQYLKRLDDTVSVVSRETDEGPSRIDRLFADTERWDVVSESADGFVFRRRERLPRVNLGNLVGLRLGNAGAPFLLGYVVSLRQCGLEETSGGAEAIHEVGVKLLPGLPEPVSFQLDEGATEEAFHLKATAAMGGATTLVVPLATFREPTQVKLFQEARHRDVRLDALLMRGMDFDHVRFVRAD
jgi:hypothetical protein